MDNPGPREEMNLVDPANFVQYEVREKFIASLFLSDNYLYIIILKLSNGIKV